MAAMIKRRTRMVSIRLLDVEYQMLKELCVEKGARSVSDLARAAMFQELAQAATTRQHEMELSARVGRIDQEVSRLTEKMEALESRLLVSPSALS